MSTSITKSSPLAIPAYILRGISQIFFVNNAASGLLIAVAMATVHPLSGVLVVLGSAVQSLGAWALGYKEEIVQGLMGYNGALVGAAASFALEDIKTAILMTVVGSFACVPVHLLVAKLFATKPLGWAALPVSTAPFCAVAGMMVGIIYPMIENDKPTSTTHLLSGLGLGFFNNFSEVVLSDTLLTGALIIVALFIGSPGIALFGMLGSAVQLLEIFVTPFSITQVSAGILGYSAVLVSIAIGAVFWADKSWVWRIGGAVVGVLCTLVLQPLLMLTPIPVYTWPFLLSMWLVLLAGGALSKRAR